MTGEVSIIGKVVKPEGVRGFLKLDVEPGFEKSVHKAPYIFIYIDGLPVPFKVEEVLSDKNLIVKLEDIYTPEEAARYARFPIGLHEKHIRYSRKLPVTSLETLVGYLIVREGHQVGKIKEVARFPGQMMAIAEDETGKIFHIPLVKEWILQKDIESGILHMSLPEGLLEV